MSELTRTKPRVCAAFVACGASFVSSAAAGETELETARLAYTVDRGSAQCPDEESFRHQVAARLGYQPFVPDGKHRVAVTFKGAGARVRGHAEVTRAGQAKSGERALEGDVEHCDSLAAALATAVAIALDPVRSARPLEPLPPPNSTVTPARSEGRGGLPQGEPAKASQEKAATRRAPLRWFGAAAIVGDVGLMPAPGLGGDVGVGARYEAASVQLSARMGTTPAPGVMASGDRLEATVISALLSPCGHLGPATVCALGRVGSLQGRASNVVSPNLGSTLVGSVGARAGYTLPLSPVVALRAMLSGEFLLVRTSLRIGGAPVWTAPPVAGALELGAVVSVP